MFCILYAPSYGYIEFPRGMEENRFLKDKLVEMNAIVTAECQLSYNGTTASYSLEYGAS